MTVQGLPADAAAFRARLRAEADKPSGDDRVILTIPILPNNPDQIRIAWNSVPPEAGPAAVARPATRGRLPKRSVPKRSVAKKAKKAKKMKRSTKGRNRTRGRR